VNLLGTDQKAGRWLGLCLLATTALAYARSLGFDFVWDDKSLIVNNPWVFQRGGWPGFLFRSFWAVGGRHETFRAFYRPLVMLSYRLNATWLGRDALGFHLVNVALHLVNSAMVLWLARRFFNNLHWALLAAVVFSLHPVHVENVAWISGRTDLLAGFFGLGSLIFWRRAEERKSRAGILAGTLFYFAALLSKEAAVFFPMALLLFPLPGRDRNSNGVLSRERKEILIGAGLVLVFYLFLRGRALGAEMSPVFLRGWALNLSAWGLVLAAYVRLSFRILGFSPMYGDLQAESIEGPLFWWGLGLLALQGAALWTVHRRSAAWTRILWLYLIFLLPVLSLRGFGGALYADRYLYLSGLGLGFAAALAGEALARRGLRRWAGEKVALMLAGAVGLVYGVSTVAATAAWKNDVSLFTRASQTAGSSPAVWNNLGLAWSMGNGLDAAERSFRAALRLQPEYTRARHNLGVVLRKQQRFEEAQKEFEAVIEQEPSNAAYTFTLAEMLAARGRVHEAESWYEKTLALKEDYLEARHNLGELLLGQQRLEEAREHFLRVIRAHPFPVMSLNSLGILEARAGRPDEARRCFERALALDPNFKPALNNLALLKPSVR
jgi:tetratricopeptide (TPR) repeat protein